MIALCELVERKRGRVIVVQNERWKKSKIIRALRPFTVIREIAAVEPQIVITQYPTYPFFWSLDRPRDIKRSIAFTRMLRRYCDRTGAKFVLDYGDQIYGSQLSVPEELFSRFEHMVFTSPDALWCHSPALSNLVSLRYHTESKLVQTVLNGSFWIADFSENHASESDTLKLVYAGDLKQHVRGIEDLLGVIAKVTDPGCRFFVCGHNGGWLKDSLTQNNIEYLGELPRSQVHRLLASCDVGLIARPVTGRQSIGYDFVFPAKLPEYVCAGLAILCADSKATADFVRQHRLGLVAPFEDWPEAIRKFIQDREFLQRCKENARALAPEMLWDRIYDKAFDELKSHFWGA